MQENHQICVFLCQCLALNIFSDGQNGFKTEKSFISLRHTNRD